MMEAKGITWSLGAPNPAWNYGDVNSQGRLLKGSNHWAVLQDEWRLPLWRMEMRKGIHWASLAGSVQRSQRREWVRIRETWYMQQLLFCCTVSLLPVEHISSFWVAVPTVRWVVWRWLTLTSHYLEWACNWGVAKYFFSLGTVTGLVMAWDPSQSSKS